MGDTGALALGGLTACVAIFSGLTLLIPLIGIMYVITSISVIIQVIHFKRTKGKRIFLMAPLHHHFERKGVAEAKISALYAIATVMAGIVCLMLYFVFF